MRETGLEEPVLLVDLQKLVGRARAVALAPGLRHIGVVELAFEPQCRGERPLARRLDARLQRPAALAARSAAGHRPGPRRCGPTRSSRISWLRMPSRRPRSAIREPLGGELDPDRLKDGAAGQHQVRPLVPDAGVGGALVVTHRPQPFDRDIHVPPIEPKTVDGAPVVTRQVQMHARDRRHGAGRAKQVKPRAALFLGDLVDERR